MTVLEYRKETKEVLKTLFGDEASDLGDILLSEYMDTERSKLLTMIDDEMDENVIMKMDEAINKLGMGVPVQYVLGNCWFFGRKIFVGEGCFIPRSDTETLVQTAIAALPDNGKFADICTGSGCIPAAISSIKKNSKGYALELSHKAIPYAEKNLEEFKNVSVLRFDALEDEDYEALRDKLEREGGLLDVVTCNPPYIRTADIDFLQQQVQFEPHTALDGGEDGLKYYRAVTSLAPIIMKDSGALIFELGYDQAGDVSEIMASNGFKTATVKDLHGIERVILGKKY